MKLNWYTATVSIQEIRIRAKDEEQAEEMYARFFGCGEEDTCPNHPEVKAGDEEWECGCVEAWDDCDHTMTYDGPASEEELV